VKEKLANEKLWKTKNGFDNLDKKSTFNLHPKKPHQSVLDDLKTSYAETKEQQAWERKMS